MEETLVLKLDVEILLDITNCIVQLVDENNVPKTEFYQISIWFPDIANKLRNANCPANGYHTFIKTKDDFGNASLCAHATIIWENELVPIEIVQSTGAIYYSIPKSVIDNNTVRNYIILNAETEIPNVEDFKRIDVHITFEQECEQYKFNTSNIQYGMIKYHIETGTSEDTILKVLDMVNQCVAKEVGLTNILIMIKDMIFGEYNSRPCILLEKMTKAIYKFDSCDIKDIANCYQDNIILFRAKVHPTLLITTYMDFVLDHIDDNEEIYIKINEKLTITCMGLQTNK